MLGGSKVAVIAVAVTITLHMIFISEQNRELLFIALVAVIGGVVEFGFVWFDVLKSPSDSLLPPLWLLALWPLFATTLNHSTKWFQQHLWISAVAGAIAGPLTYYTGTRLTDYEIVAPQSTSMLKLMIVWMLVFPFVMWIASLHNSRGDR